MLLTIAKVLFIRCKGKDNFVMTISLFIDGLCLYVLVFLKNEQII